MKQETARKPIKCHMCGNICDGSSPFCSRCDARLLILHTDTPNLGTTVWQKVKSAFGAVPRRVLIRNLLLLFVSISLLFFAFMPVSQVRVDLDSITGSSAASAALPLNADAVFGVTPLDNIDAFFYMLQDLNQPELQYLSSTEEMLSVLMENLDGALASGDLMSALEHMLGSVAHRAVLLQLASEDASFRVSVVIAAVVSLLYLLLCVAVAVVALLNVIFLLAGKRPLYRANVSLLSLVPAMLPAVLICIYPTLPTTNSVSVGLGIGGILALAFSLVAVFSLMIERMLSEQGRVTIWRAIRATVPLLLVCAMFFFAFMPVFSVGTYVMPKGHDRETLYQKSFLAVDSSYLFTTCLQEDYLLSLDDAARASYVKNALSLLDARTKFEVADSAQWGFALTAVMGADDGSDKGSQFSYMILLQVALLIALGLVAWQLLRAYALGNTHRIFCLVARILLVVLAAIMVFYVLALLVFVNERLGLLQLKDEMLISIEYAPIVTAVLALLTCLFPMGRKGLRVRRYTTYVLEGETVPRQTPYAPEGAAPAEDEATAQANQIAQVSPAPQN